MTLESILTIVAIVIGPLLAVQATYWIDVRRERRNRRISIFRTLMATRAANISPAHVEALNSIDLEFTDKKFKPVKLAWKAYLAHLNNKEIAPELWGTKRTELLVDLLHSMGKCLNYDFDKTGIEWGAYFPIAHGEVENDQVEIRKGLKSLLKGELVLPLHVVNLDTPSDASEGPLKIEQKSDTPVSPEIKKPITE